MVERVLPPLMITRFLDRAGSAFISQMYSQTRFLSNTIFWAQASYLGLSLGKGNKISK